VVKIAPSLSTLKDKYFADMPASSKAKTMAFPTLSSPSRQRLAMVGPAPLRKTARAPSEYALSKTLSKFGIRDFL
jgi:hypothetical protein